MSDQIASAMQIITKALNEDKSQGSYYYSWQSNIAMAFYDECNHWRDQFNRETIPATAIHEIANNAAKRFLNLLIDTPEPEKQ